MTLNTIIVFLLISTGNFGPSRGFQTVIATTPSLSACNDAKANEIAAMAAAVKVVGQDLNILTCSRAEIVNLADPYRGSAQH